MKKIFAGLLGATLLTGSMVANAIEIFGTTTHTLLRGTLPGDFPGQYYGGTFPGVFPVVLSEAQARAAVLG